MLYLTIALSSAVFTPRVIIPGVQTAGDNFNIICRLDGVVERLAVTPIVTMTFTTQQGGEPRDQSQDGLAYVRPRAFQPGTTDDVGTYSCFVSIFAASNFYGGSASNTLQMQSMCILKINTYRPAIIIKYFIMQFLHLNSPS